MLPKIDFTQTPTYKYLLDHYIQIAPQHLQDLFAKDPLRFEKFSIELGDLLFDFSKNRIDEKTIAFLTQMASECQLEKAIDQLFEGAPINETEKRPVLHTALRSRNEKPIFVDGQNIISDIKQLKEKMKLFSEQVINGNWKGYTEKPITDIVNIGIGGSDLGPLMVTEALKPYKNHLKSHFVSNIDGANITEVLSGLNPETTLFLIASKTFTTQETMANARVAKKWFLDQAPENEINKSFNKHFIAISGNPKAVSDFGIDPDNRFIQWDWIGGRFSLWGATGLSIALSLGFESFTALLDGAEAADLHFKNTEFEKNIPVIMALLGIWYNNFFDAETHAIVPYDQNMHFFASYFQQGDMESNGKQINRLGERVDYQTGSVIWGGVGTNAQHAFFQLLHQGTKLIPADFIGMAQSHYPVGEHHQLLLSNFFAQTEALMNGTETLPTAGQEYIDKFRQFEGNRPSNSFLIKKMTPYELGKLIALYEHKIFVQGILWNIFSFDQWGVELGKQLARDILTELQHEPGVLTTSRDSSTNGLINRYKKWQQS